MIRIGTLILFLTLSSFAQDAVIGKRERASLAQSYRDGQSSQRLALRHRQKLEIDELGRSQGIQRRKWLKNQKLKLDQFFVEVRDPMARRRLKQRQAGDVVAYDVGLKKAIALRASQQKEEYRKLVKSQSVRLTEFKKVISDGKRPGKSFWSDLSR